MVNTKYNATEGLFNKLQLLYIYTLEDRRCYEGNNKSKLLGSRIKFWLVIRFCPLTFHFNLLKEMNKFSKTNTFNSN